MTRVFLIEEFGRGGIAQYTVDVAQLVADVVEVRVATTTRGPASRCPVAHEVWFPVGAGGRLANLRGGVVGLMRAVSRVRRNDVAWIPLGVRPAYEMGLALALKLRGAVLVATVHNRAPHDRDRVFSRWLVRRSARLAHHTVVHSSALTQWARASRLRGEVLPFPTPQVGRGDPAGKHTRASLEVEDGAVLVALVGNLYRYKGVDVLLSALRELGPCDPDVCVVLAGQADPDDDLPGLIQQGGLQGRVRVLPGYLPDGELIDVMLAADVVALPYRQIDHSGVGALARSLGVPAVASDLPSLRELLGDSAIYVPPGDAAALAGALRRLPGRLPDLRTAARERPAQDVRGPYQAFITEAVRGAGPLSPPS